MLKRVEIFTDGSATPDGRGGWAAILRYGPHEKVLSGGAVGTTNNRMELTAALEGLKALKVPCRVDIFTDSEYLRKAFTDGWLARWQASGWRTSQRKPVQNRDLWEALLEETARHQVNWHWVPGHAGVAANERVDRLAREAREAVATT